MAYQFRLETVLVYRRNLEEQAQLALAHEIRVLTEHQNILIDLRDMWQRMADDFDERKKKSMDAAFFTYCMDSLRRKQWEIEAQLSVIKKQQGIVDESRAQLGERVKSRKVIEKAREKDYQKYLQEVRRKEQNESDEQAVLRAGREDNLF
ncbi:MAG: flagellar export protein FliJ [Desulfobulbaceae bacterium]|nr:flagellar export protein FliJ [Desulfobulbaceae bacterium]